MHSSNVTPRLSLRRIEARYLLNSTEMIRNRYKHLIAGTQPKIFSALCQNVARFIDT